MMKRFDIKRCLILLLMFVTIKKKCCNPRYCPQVQKYLLLDYIATDSNLGELRIKRLVDCRFRDARVKRSILQIFVQQKIHEHIHESI